MRYLFNQFVADQLDASEAALLHDNLYQESSLLATPLRKLFATEQTPST